MNEIRKNTDEEVVVAKGILRLPKLLLISGIFLMLVACACIAIGVLTSNLLYGDGTMFTVMGVMALIFSLAMVVYPAIALRKCSCTITNKRIYGETILFLTKKNYSYRLDAIDNVELQNTMGMRVLMINFDQGKTTANAKTTGKGATNNTFRIGYLHNATEMLEKLNEQMTNIKNDKDVMIDIEMKKVEVEEMKANAFMNMATNQFSKETNASNSSSYIDELRNLKQLLDEGIISQEEFDVKKSKLLDSNK